MTEDRFLTQVARAVGNALGRISRGATPSFRAVRPPQARAASVGATEDQVNMRLTVPERINRAGTKVEDEAGTGVHDSQGG